MVFTDNVLAILATFCKSVILSNHETGNVMKDVNGVIFSVQVYAKDVQQPIGAMNRSPVVHETQIGKGTSIPTRQDFNIENPFTNGGAEDNRNPSFEETYVNATEIIEMSTPILATGNGSITEVCKFVVINGSDGTDHTILVMRDIISPPVSFFAGDVINITNEVVT